MKKLSSPFLAAFAALFLAVPASAADDAPEVSAHAAIMMHADTLEVLYEKNADEHMLIASTTKLMTALVALEECRPDDMVDITPEMCGIEGSSMYLHAGEKYSVEELLCGLLLVSGNDAATALALHTAGSIEEFARLMNEKAQELGMMGTHYENPHGLDAPEHYSTARDLALLMADCMDEPVIAEIGASSQRTVGEKLLMNHNRLINEYPGCTGGKTGYTMAAGRCLVTCAEREETRFICVTLSDPDDWADHAALYDWAFGNYVYAPVIDPEMEIRLPVAGEESAVLYPASEARVLLEKGGAAEPETHIELPPFIFGPVRSGEELGRVSVTLNGEEIASRPLVSAAGAGNFPLLEQIKHIERFIGLAGPYYLRAE